MPIIKEQKLFHFENISGTYNNDVHEFEQNIRREINIRHGLWISIINFSPKQSIQMHFKREFPVIDFGFIFEGDIKKKLDMDSFDKKELHIKNGISGVQYSSDQSGVFTINPRKRQQILHIHTSIDFLQGLLKNECFYLHPYLKSIMNGESKKQFSITKPMSPEIQTVVYQILNSSNNTIPRDLYLEGKTLELLSLHLGALSMGHKQSNEISLSPLEKERLSTAKEILTQDLLSPPTLHLITSETGLSANKLQKGFHQIYGTSVFDYLREFKMQTARTLLEKNETNVSETAWSVGYTNVSHFSAAFKKRFGVLPKQYLKASLKNQQSISCK